LFVVVQAALRQTSAPAPAVHMPFSVGKLCGGSTGIGVPFDNFGIHVLCDSKHQDWDEHWASLEQTWALAGGLYRTPAIAIATRKAQKRSAQRKFIRRCSPTSTTQYGRPHAPPARGENITGQSPQSSTQDSVRGLLVAESAIVRGHERALARTGGNHPDVCAGVKFCARATQQRRGDSGFASQFSEIRSDIADGPTPAHRTFRAQGRYSALCLPPLRRPSQSVAAYVPSNGHNPRGSQQKWRNKGAVIICAAHESLRGTFRTLRDVRVESVVQTKTGFGFLQRRSTKKPVGPRRGVVRESDARSQTRR
jgi:hypothetical protein